MPNACASAKRWTIRREAGDGFGNPGANLMADISSLADVGSALSANCS
jgi:hypothetical protein